MWTFEHFRISKYKTTRQLLSYVLIGVASNALGYSLYLIVTYFWGAPKLSMTILYLAGALISFFANRNFTFQHDGKVGQAGVRFLFAQILGYIINLILLTLFVDWLDYSHQIVQGVAIILVAIYLFLMLRFFVFKH